MLSFFKKSEEKSTLTEDKVEVATKSNDEKLANVLTKISAFIQATAIYNIGGTYGESDTTLFTEETKCNANEFVDKIHSGARYLERKGMIKGVVRTYFNITVSNDFATWSQSEIDELKVFFNTFQQYPLLLKIDAKQLITLNSDKFKLFIRSLSEVSDRLTILVSNCNGQEEYLFDKDQTAIIQANIPKTEILAGEFFKAHDGLLNNLMYAYQAKGKNSFSIEAPVTLDTQHTSAQTKGMSFNKN